MDILKIQFLMVHVSKMYSFPFFRVRKQVSELKLSVITVHAYSDGLVHILSSGLNHKILRRMSGYDNIAS